MSKSNMHRGQSHSSDASLIPRGLHTDDLAYLEAHGIRESTALAAGAYHASKFEIETATGSGVSVSGLVFPYPGSDYVRVRLHNDPHGKRWHAPTGPVRPYLPSMVPAEVWSDPAQRLHIVEGVPKALSLCQEKVWAVSGGGVDAGLTDKEALLSGDLTLHPDFARIEWSGREVVICFDAGRSVNPLVALAEAKLAAALRTKGASVLCLALPMVNGKDIGPDEFKKQEGLPSLLALLRSAHSAHPLKRLRDVLQKSPEGREPDALRGLLSDLPFLASLRFLAPFELSKVKAECKAYRVSAVEVNRASAFFAARLRDKANHGEVQGEAWFPKLTRNKQGEVRSSIDNAALILCHDKRWRNVLLFNEFTGRVVFQLPPPWDEDFSPQEQVTIGSSFTDDDAVRLQAWLSRYYSIALGPAACLSLAVIVSKRASYHPVRHYLQGLQWDGTPRLDAWLITHWGAEDTPYTRAIGAKSLVGACARVFVPGCKLDTMLVAEGGQGALKSSGFRALFGDRWFTDDLADFGSKDAALQLIGIWAVEQSELDQYGRAEIARTKAWMTRQVDRYRAPYDRLTEEHPRQMVFVGTCNDSEYLKDPTGARRFWPFRVGRIDLEAIKRDRDQLWAEAYARYQSSQGQPFRWWLSPQEEALAQVEQHNRYDEDVWEEDISAYLSMGNRGRDGVTMAEVMTAALRFEARHIAPKDQSRAKKILTRLGWGRRQIGRKWLYLPKAAPLPPDPQGSGAVSGAGQVVDSTATTPLTPLTSEKESKAMEEKSEKKTKLFGDPLEPPFFSGVGVSVVQDDPRTQDASAAMYGRGGYTKDPEEESDF